VASHPSIMKHGWVISSTTPPIIRDAFAISQDDISDREGDHTPCNGPAQVKGNSEQRFEGKMAIGLGNCESSSGTSNRRRTVHKQ
jgi:hypothetical protein